MLRILLDLRKSIYDFVCTDEVMFMEKNFVQNRALQLNMLTAELESA